MFALFGSKNGRNGLGNPILAHFCPFGRTLGPSGAQLGIWCQFGSFFGHFGEHFGGLFGGLFGVIFGLFFGPRFGTVLGAILEAFLVSFWAPF